jgi:hypothetical protein
LSNLSDKELLEQLSEFPMYELTTEQRTKTLKLIGDFRARKRVRKINFQRLGAFAAMFILIVIAPILYFTNGKEETTPRTGTIDGGGKGDLKIYQQGVYFALKDKDGIPRYADSNFGIPNKVSLLAPKEWVADDDRSTAKVMVFLWGKDIDVNQILNIDAVNLKTDIKEHLNNTPLSAGMYGADAHAVTSLQSLVKPGKWNLEFSIDGKKIGEFIIEVKDTYVLIGQSTLLISQQDIHPGFYKEAYIEVEGDKLPGEIELELFSIETGERTVFTFKDKRDYTNGSGKKISLYEGDFQIKNSGKYEFSVLKQTQPVVVRKD